MSVTDFPVFFFCFDDQQQYVKCTLAHFAGKCFILLDVMKHGVYVLLSLICQPSISSQAAKLLAASGHAPAGFIGFSSQPAFVPASETFDDAESAIDSDFRLALRRLSKRDSVTKIKVRHFIITSTEGISC